MAAGHTTAPGFELVTSSLSMQSESNSEKGLFFFKERARTDVPCSVISDENKAHRHHELAEAGVGWMGGCGGEACREGGQTDKQAAGLQSIRERKITRAPQSAGHL